MKLTLIAGLDQGQFKGVFLIFFIASKGFYLRYPTRSSKTSIPSPLVRKLISEYTF